MKTFGKRAPVNFPRALSDLAAEGGSARASGAAPAILPETAYVQARRLPLGKPGRRVAGAVKS